MLPKTKRVKRALFQKVFSSGRTLHSTYLTARIVLTSPTPLASGAPSKFSFVVSKAVAKKAVDRNLLRRRGYSVISKLYNLFPAGLVVVFFYKKGADKLSYASLSKEIEDIFKKVGFLKK